ncbi:protein-L-isoaspartate O-methyltransferase [Pseudolabrys taiwanensis]|uniref:Protein-L-isoaspartate O-methyltransferase n=1 Tax=Pseudolabrys taiwanensis TaxID=331696 RepID=A0A345ZSC5_9HYPH|nr:protein-L-isoaspartate O-methyltransferase [Pseudolabrys taiwanensis]AXK79822.1 protein-L-isoaspartate O-methyltransferase [Pseudolabrys taiwanensis]
MTDFSTARRHMVDGQVRTSDVTDLRILQAMQDVPRERFVPASAAGLAYLDLDLPLGRGGRCLLRPMVLSKLLQAAEIGAADRVLDVGCATGYAAAILARFVPEVVALEDDAGFAETARAALGSQANVKVVTGPLAQGWAQGAPYDVILLEGSADVAPEALCRQLKDGGRLVFVLGSGPDAKAVIYRRSGDEIGYRSLFDAAAPLLPGFAKATEFAF